MDSYRRERTDCLQRAQEALAQITSTDRSVGLEAGRLLDGWTQLEQTIYSTLQTCPAGSLLEGDPFEGFREELGTFNTAMNGYLRAHDYFKSVAPKEDLPVITAPATAPAPPPLPLPEPGAHTSQLTAVYVGYFGEPASVSHELDMTVAPHVDVFRFDRQEQHLLHTYATCGMSTRDQPPQQRDDLRRIELVLYSDILHDKFPELLRKFSRFPWECAPFGGWDLVSLGNFSEAALGFPGYGGLLVTASLDRKDSDLATRMRALHPCTSPLTVTPLLQDEFDYASEHGIDALVQRCNASKHSWSMSHTRHSVLSDTKEL